MDKEFERVTSLLEGTTVTEHNGQTFATGRAGGNIVVATQCGIGKVNAAVGTVQLIDAFAPDAVISTGVAGGADTTLDVCDAVVSTQTCYHDVYCGEETTFGQVFGMPARFSCSETIVNAALSLSCSTHIRPGLIVTGDWFVDSRDKMRAILDRFPDATAVDMESAAIAHVCRLRCVPFVSFRVISDIPLKDSKAQQYVGFWQRLADSSFSVTHALLEAL